MSDLHSYRDSYEKGKLLESQLDNNPFHLFEQWFKNAEASKTIREVNAMTVSVIGEDGYPKGRVVLLKEYDDEGFVFYTNYTSEKATGIMAHPKVSMSFFWPELEQQIIIKGISTKVTEERSAAYFKTRPRGSQLGAWASHQSDVVDSRDTIEDRLKKIEEQFEGKDIPKPDFWGGFIIKPISFEFWQGRPNRLHDRIRYVQNEDGSWYFNRLEP